jgi:hypothetical protein
VNSSLDRLAPTVDVGEYCRRVEEHLMRVNDGHLVRIFGPGFELVRGWALGGVPLSIACYGIDQKAERHRAGSSKRPLRIEFCDVDVQEAFARWRRAVGVTSGASDASADSDGPAPAEALERRRPSLTKELDRAADRLVRAAGRMETPPSLRDALGGVLDAVVDLREKAKKRRGSDRDALLPALAELDAALRQAARAATADLTGVRAEAENELGPYRRRLAADAWERSVSAGVDRLLRERYGLPTLDLEQL